MAPSVSRQVLRGLNRYRHNFHTWRHIEWAAVNHFLEAKAGHRVLDLACGKGHYTTRLASKGVKVHALDIDPHKLAWATTYHNCAGCSYCRGNGERLPYSDQAFDRVISVCALEHFADPPSALREIRRVLCDSGTLALSVDSLTNPAITSQQRAYHQRKFQAPNLFTRESLRECLQSASLEMLECRSLFRSRLAHVLYQWGARRGFTGVAFLLRGVHPKS